MGNLKTPHFLVKFAMPAARCAITNVLRACSVSCAVYRVIAARGLYYFLGYRVALFQPYLTGKF
jgi:hypothetical protein